MDSTFFEISDHVTEDETSRNEVFVFYTDPEI